MPQKRRGRGRRRNGTLSRVFPTTDRRHMNLSGNGLVRDSCINGSNESKDVIVFLQEKCRGMAKIVRKPMHKKSF
jgi:hypothetical protein